MTFYYSSSGAFGVFGDAGDTEQLLAHLRVPAISETQLDEAKHDGKENK
jgi:hypothetical protein